MPEKLYTSGEYFKNNPTWDAEDSPWKASQIMRMIERNSIRPKTICEVGCGAGEILAELQRMMDKDCVFSGYEISPQAFELCKDKISERLHFKLGDIMSEKDAHFDLVLLIDVIEHVEDHYSFLRNMKSKGEYKILHIPLDLSAQSVLRAGRLEKNRESVGHIHYFTKETALGALKDAGYEVLDHFYTASIVDLPARSFLSYIAKMPRKLLFAANKDLAVRLLGGYSLMVLTR
jgi:SAM-dependent methyltransferase